MKRIVHKILLRLAADVGKKTRNSDESDDKIYLNKAVSDSAHCHK